MNNQIPFPIPTKLQQMGPRLAEVPSITVAECKMKFLNAKYSAKKLENTTFKPYEGEINRLMRFLPKGSLTLISDVTVDILEKYVGYANTEKRKWEDHPFNSNADVSQIGLKATTVNNMRRYLSVFFNWLVKKQFISENPITQIEAINEDKVGYGHILEKLEVWGALAAAQSQDIQWLPRHSTHPSSR